MRTVRLVVGLLLAAVLAACAHIGMTTSERPAPLTAMTYNIRLDLASDGANAWPRRKAMVAALIGHEAPDILGMQEVLLHQKRDLETALPQYSFVGVGRDDGAEAGEFSPLAWRTARFELVGNGTFWLSPTPDVPGKGWDAAYPRIATWVLLRDRGDGRHYRVLVTHLDNAGQLAREHGAEMIAKWSKERVAAGETVIVMGDFNATPDSPPMIILSDSPRSGMRLARDTSAEPPYGPAGTFNDFEIDGASGEPIDHILVSADLDVLSYAVVTQHWNGRLPSDHYPVIAVMRARR